MQQADRIERPRARCGVDAERQTTRGVEVAAEHCRVSHSHAVRRPEPHHVVLQGEDRIEIVSAQQAGRSELPFVAVDVAGEKKRFV
ncbi:MAG: hypothetical protein MUC68_00980 [Burkholderiaceae bacterium]|nr:hypothetical protein [Burkholderiaceae bacterium]